MYMICVYTWIFKWYLFRLIVSFGRIYMYIYKTYVCVYIYIYVLKICVCVCVCVRAVIDVYAHLTETPASLF